MVVRLFSFRGPQPQPAESPLNGTQRMVTLFYYLLTIWSEFFLIKVSSWKTPSLSSMFLNELQTQFYKRSQPIQRTHRRHDPLCGSFGALTKNNHGTWEALMGSWLWEKSAALRARKEQKWGSIIWLWKPLLTSFLTEGQSQPHGQAAALMSLRSWRAVLGALAAVSAVLISIFQPGSEKCAVIHY